jgi:hypothetical protein
VGTITLTWGINPVDVTGIQHSCFTFYGHSSSQQASSSQSSVSSIPAQIKFANYPLNPKWIYIIYKDSVSTSRTTHPIIKAIRRKLYTEIVARIVRISRSQLPRRSVAARLFGLHIRIPPLSLVSIVCCQVEVSATGWSLVQRSPAECGVSERDYEASVMWRPWPTRGCCAMGKNKILRITGTRTI